VKTGLWVAVDGSKFDFGKIDAEKDMYEPDDRSLFAEDSEQEDEECEGDTGTAGVYLSLDVSVQVNRGRAELLASVPIGLSLSCLSLSALSSTRPEIALAQHSKFSPVQQHHNR
jgi:hypothetical protein